MYGVSGSRPAAVEPGDGPVRADRARSRCAPPRVATLRPRHAAAWRPARRTTRTRSTDGAAATAASATDLRSTQAPRRRKPSDRDEQLRLAVDQAGGDRRRAVAGEDRREDRARGRSRPGPRRRSRAASAAGSRPGRPRRHRARPGRRVVVRTASARPRLVSVRTVAVLALPRDGDAVRVAGGSRLDRGPRPVERRARPPAGPGRSAARVERRARPARPGDPDVVRSGAPEPGRVRDRPGLQRVERRLLGQRAGSPPDGMPRRQPDRVATRRRRHRDRRSASRGSRVDVIRPAVRRLVAQERAARGRSASSVSRPRRSARSGTSGNTSAMRSALWRVMTVSAAATMQISAPSIGASSARRAAVATSRAST